LSKQLAIEPNLATKQLGAERHSAEMFKQSKQQQYTSSSSVSGLQQQNKKTSLTQGQRIQVS